MREWLERRLGRKLAHVNARYVVDRLGVAIDQRRHPDHPWLTRAAVAFLEDWIKPTDRGFEWGSGRSTIWFARRMVSLTSVEHDFAWAERVKGWIAKHGLEQKISYLFAEDGAREEPSSQYVRAIADVPNGSLNLVLVDGVARAHCAVAALDKIAVGGILIIDNANWYLPGPRASRSPNSRNGLPPVDPTWSEVKRRLADWRCLWTSNGVFDTAIWFRPCG